MDVRSLGSVGFGASQDFAGDRRDLANAEQQEAHKVSRWVPFRPLKVDVRLSAGHVSEMKKECGQSVRNSRTLHREDAVLLVHHMAANIEPCGELRWVCDRDLHEDEVLLLGEVVVPHDL